MAASSDCLPHMYMHCNPLPSYCREEAQTSTGYCKQGLHIHVSLLHMQANTHTCLQAGKGQALVQHTKLTGHVEEHYGRKPLDAPTLRLVSLQKAVHAGRQSDKSTTKAVTKTHQQTPCTLFVSCLPAVAGHREARPQWTVWLHPYQHCAVSTCTAQDKVGISATAWRHSACTCAARASCRHRKDPQTDQTNQHDACEGDSKWRLAGMGQEESDPVRSTCCCSGHDHTAAGIHRHVSGTAQKWGPDEGQTPAANDSQSCRTTHTVGYRNLPV